MGAGRLFGRLFFGVSIAAALFTAVESVMQSLGSSICVTEGCAVVAQHTRYGDLSILAIGFATFSLLAVLSGLDLRSGTGRNGRLMTFVLVISLASEGFFTGYQAFHVGAACLFCLIIFGFIAMLSGIRFAGGDRDVLAGFAAWAAVFALLYLVLPAGAVMDLPKDDRLVLFTSPECKHCADVKQEIERQGIAVSHQRAADYAPLLKRLGIEHVPTLYVNTPGQKAFLTGKEPILNYLLCDRKPQRSPRASAPAQAGGSAKPEASAPAPLVPVLPPDQLFGPIILDDGACRENRECK